ncbi:MAG: molybdopterin-synthase adenylyltransferase MoeB [Betaproteobacteria bacterium]|nr:MAG: molybdopterin-synthase adenylyltransferase MoeB [Betaproteobacteria bacterium]
MNDQDLLRYSRHILLDEWDVTGQSRVSASHALVIGAGGLGCPAAMFLASAGVGAITLADHDRVDLTNLQRQIGHTTASVDELKVASLANTLRAINPTIAVHTIAEKLSGDALNRAVAAADVVLDCTDLFGTRHAINRACIAARKPLVSGAAIRFDGQVSVFDSRDAASPCYHCIYPESDSFEETRCAEMGVFAPLVGIVGSLQAAEALKLLSGLQGGEALCGRLLTIDAKTMDIATMRFCRDASCAVCGRH